MLQGLGWGAVTAFVLLVNGPFLEKTRRSPDLHPGRSQRNAADGLMAPLHEAARLELAPGGLAPARRGPFSFSAHCKLASVTVIARTLVGAADGGSWLPMLFLFWSGIMLAWQVSYMAATALRRANRFEAEALRLDVLAKEAELKALQAQVNPHFFFNSLNSVRALIFREPAIGRANDRPVGDTDALHAGFQLRRHRAAERGDGGRCSPTSP